MIAWASIIGFVIFSSYIMINMYVPPSCYDRKLNQEELGVDCGGTCDLMCDFQIQPLDTVWVRSFEVSPGLWSALAYLENPNPESYVSDAKYRFNIYDRNNKLIATKEGKTFITKDVILPVFAGRINIDEGVPYKTTLEWTKPLIWMRVDSTHEVVLEEQQISGANRRPEIDATLINKEPNVLEDVEVIAIVYDEQQNAIAVSKTYVDKLSARGKQHITFSWFSPFESKYKRWQLIPRVPPQKD